MRVEERASTDQVRRGRDRYVPRGVATTDLIVTRAWGARIWDADGREYIDFAGGIGLPEPRPRQCSRRPGGARAGRPVPPSSASWSGRTSPYVAVAEKLDEVWPGKAATKTLLRELWRRGDRERGQDRPRSDRPRRGRRLRPRVSRPHEPDHGNDVEARLQAGLRPARERTCTVRRRRIRIAASRPRTHWHGLELLFKQDVDPAEVACIVLEPVQGEGGFIPMPTEFIHALAAPSASTHGIVYVDDEVQSGCGRTGTSGRSSGTTSSPTCSSPARRSAADSHSRG